MSRRSLEFRSGVLGTTQGQERASKGDFIAGVADKYLAVKRHGLVITATPALDVGQTHRGVIGIFPRGQTLVGGSRLLQATGPSEAIGNNQLQCFVRFSLASKAMPAVPTA